MTLHDDALAVLSAWVPPDPAQDALRQEYVAHLRARPDALSRTCRPDHFTCGMLVLSADGRRVLLNLHAKARAWFAFGGHCEDGDATLLDAALREATEESGVEGLLPDPVPLGLDTHPVPFCGPDGDTRHLDVRFLAVAPHDAAPRPLMSPSTCAGSPSTTSPPTSPPCSPSCGWRGCGLVPNRRFDPEKAAVCDQSTRSGARRAPGHADWSPTARFGAENLRFVTNR